MTLLAFDGRMGASGDMILAALLDAGADPDRLEFIADELAVEYRIDETDKCGITGTTVDVVLTDERSESDSGADADVDADADTDADSAETVAAAAEDNQKRGHEHAHEHTHGQHSHDDHTSHDGHTHAEGHGPHRSYREVRDIVDAMGLPGPVERDALAIFKRLGEAEASVHGEALEDIHFHEVGADDAIADIVGAVVLLHDLNPDRIVTTPLATGGGTASMAHGEYPIPTPAVVELAADADWALRGGPVDAELLTPTGAAILAHVADGVDSLPELELTSAGYGAGGYDLDPHPNMLRVLVGTGSGGLVKDDIAVLETNLDDAAPEVLGGLQETLADAGARDVSIVPVTMKKSRPGHLVKVICKPEDRRRVARRLAEETGTLGVRDAGATHRWIAQREFRTAAVELAGDTYEVTVKVASDSDGEIYDVSAEYDDAAAVAHDTDLPIRTVITRAEALVRDGRALDGDPERN
ncbi:nickel pincer cofactor biosynthesis protein LarC [Natrialba sp. PRR66]|uniref:nickel pincer cofactor biosynthesis protein LarC n=1 Tax=Natrialba sp. PRR66 TaxID=3098146 RepID=UPI002B1E7428|nr:nickel pincer cofactor biosynthesis protein LarC [Natrialba sp. PRR66]